MKAIIEATQTKITEITAFNYVDENWGQLDYYSQHPPVKWPCALIDIQAMKYSNIGMDKTATPQNRQMGEFLLEIRVANLKLSNTSARAPQAQRANAHSIWDLIEEIHQKIQGFSPIPMCGKLIRVGMNKVDHDDGVQEYSIIYSGTMNNI